MLPTRSRHPRLANEQDSTVLQGWQGWQAQSAAAPRNQITDSIELLQAPTHKNLVSWPWYNHATANPTNYAFVCPLPTDSGQRCKECVPMDEYMDHLGSKHIEMHLTLGTIWKCPLRENDGNPCCTTLQVRTDPAVRLTWRDYRKVMRHIFTSPHSAFLYGLAIVWSPLGEWYAEDGEGKIRPLPDTVCRYCRYNMNTPFGGSAKELTDHVRDTHPGRL